MSAPLEPSAALPPVATGESTRAPIVVIEPTESWLALGLGELRQYRELLYFLTWRDVKVHYRQAVLGVTWVLLQPLMLMAIFTVFYSRAAPLFDTGGVPYPLFAYSGLVLWTFFANAITASGNSLVGNVNLITKVYFPRMLVPAAAVCASVLHLFIASTVLVGMMIYAGVTPTIRLLAAPLAVIAMIVLATAIGLWASALNVRYRDVRLILPFATQVWLFASSVILPTSAVPERWRWIPRLNPVAAFVEAFRAALFGHPFDWTALGLGAAITVALLIGGAIVFRRMEQSFADEI